MKTPLLVAAAGLVAGLLAGGVWTWVQADRYRADARLLVRPASSRIVPAVEALAESSLVESNVSQTLRLSSPPHVSATRGNGGLLTVSVEAGSRERARQIDAEAVVILMQKVEQRFGPSPGVTVTQLDPAHAAEQTSPTPGRNLLIAGLVGLIGGAGAAIGLSLRRARTAAPGDPRVERRLRTRIDEVAKRERALARRAGDLAAREKELEQRAEQVAAAAARPSPSNHADARRAQELDQRERHLQRRVGELDRRDAELRRRASELDRLQLEIASRPEPEPEPEPEPIPEPPVAPAAPRAGAWTLEELERRVDERRASFPARVEEWDTYLFLLREHASIDGSLPSSFDKLIADVFGFSSDH